MRSKSFAIASLLMVAVMVLTSCGGGAATPQVVQPTSGPAPTAAVVEKTVVVTSAPQVQVVTPTPEPAKQFTSKDPNSFVSATYGDPETLDPALDYETAGGEIVYYVYDRLIDYNKEKPGEFIPSLATKWTISPDGKTYTFDIRKGVKFHDGSEMKPSDVAYSFQRGILQGNTVSPQWLLTEPLLGTGKMDPADLIDAALEDTPDKLKAEDPAKLKAACETVTKAITADDNAGTVTMTLAQSWGPFLATIANSWGSVLSKQWSVANKLWDGDCGTWQNFYGISSENDPIGNIENGTGPYKLDHWTKGQEIVLVANPNYWRTEAGWQGGPTGAPKLQRVVIKNVNEWGTRFAMLQAGDADYATVNPENWDQADTLVGEDCVFNEKAATQFDCKVTDAAKPLKRYKGLNQITHTDVFFNFAIATTGGNPLIGSGKLDGNGVPPEFFSDIHVRKAFNYCFDWETYIRDVFKGEAMQLTSMFLPGQPGYGEDQPHYTTDLDKCKSEFEASTLKSADGKSLWDTGFRLQAAYNTGNTTRRTVAEILGTNLSQVNEKFVIETVGLPWPAFLQAQRAKTLPLFISGWQEDIHDPHNWIVPYATSAGTYSGRQSLPKDLSDAWSKIATQAVSETDFAKRDALYKQFNQQYYDAAPAILLALGQGRRYVQRWVDGYYYNAIHSGPIPYYAVTKK